MNQFTLRKNTLIEFVTKQTINACPDIASKEIDWVNVFNLNGNRVYEGQLEHKLLLENGKYLTVFSLNGKHIYIMTLSIKQKNGMRLIDKIKVL